MTEQREWPTRPVELNHLEAMGIAMALTGEEGRVGLSQPQLDAQAKIGAVLMALLEDLR